MKYVSLFSGIGGLDLGLDRAGWTPIAFVEADEWCRRVLSHRWPGVPLYDDVRSFRWTAGADAVVGGFPCQDVSIAGDGRGLDGERSGLWFEMLRVVSEARPRWVVGENVPPLRHRGADSVCGGLERIGYSVWPAVVSAADVGAPHLRERVFVLAYSGGAGQQERLSPAVAARPRLHPWPAPPGVRPTAGREVERTLVPPAHGFPDGLVRWNKAVIRAAGNAVVPQVAEAIGRGIMEVDRGS